jgi:hypothetical protein
MHAHAAQAFDHLIVPARLVDTSLQASHLAADLRLDAAMDVGDLGSPFELFLVDRAVALKLDQRIAVRALRRFPLYSPKSHKLNFLRDLCEELDPRLMAAWPRDTKFNQRCFELLRRAYVDARYSPHYKINGDELTWLIEHVTILQGLVRSACSECFQRDQP